MKTKVTLIALAWLTSGIALAQAPAMAHESHAERMDRLALLLDLDAYQKTEVERVLKEHHQKMRAEHEAMRASGTRPSREEMHAKREQSKEELRTQLSGILNETQIKKFEALKEGRGHGPRHFGKKDRAAKEDRASGASNL